MFEHGRILVFASDNQLEYLAGMGKRWGVDGTFKTSPKEFKQIFTIHVFNDTGRSIPCAFALIPDKKEVSYRLVLASIRFVAQKLGLTVDPAVVMSDFEASIHSALLSEFPGVQLKFCLFHFHQSLIKKMKKFQIYGEYRKRKEPSKATKALLGMISALYVPASTGSSALNHSDFAPDLHAFWKAVCLHHTEIDENPNLTKFRKYMEATYIGSPCSDGQWKHPQFALKDWSVWGGISFPPKTQLRLSMRWKGGIQDG